MDTVKIAIWEMWKIFMMVVNHQVRTRQLLLLFVLCLYLDSMNIKRKRRREESRKEHCMSRQRVRDGFEGAGPMPKVEALSHSRATSKPKKRRVSSDNAAEEYVSILAIEKVANTINDGNKEIINAFANATVTMSNAISTSQQCIHSASEIYAELIQMKLEKPFLDEAYFWLADNEKMVKLLFGFPPERRKDVLQSMMNSSKGC